MASRLSGRPVRVEKTGASGTPARSVSHVRRAAAMLEVREEPPDERCVEVADFELQGALAR